MPGLPRTIEPMLAKLGGEPFDSEEHRFEVKWDGTRALAYVEESGWRAHNRRGRDLAPRWPELAALEPLPPGTLLDGELVVLVDGRPDFRGMLRREQARKEIDVRHRARELPAVLVVFDLLYQDGEPLLERPLTERLERLAELADGWSDPRLHLCDGVTGSGIVFFEEVAKRGLEGVVAKRLSSTYQPGRRSDAWTKIKQRHEAHCAILGWERDPSGGLKSLIVALAEDGELRCVGKVGSGLTEADRERLEELLVRCACDEPLVEPASRGANDRWVEPGLFCTVSYLERTHDGNLRAPVFRELFLDERWQQP